MLVRDRMTTSVCTVSPDSPLERALVLMRSRHIRRLPVLQQGRLVGIVTWTDLMRASPASTLSRWEIPALLKEAQVHEVMTPSPETVSPETPLEDAAAIMRRRKIGGLPVVKNGALVGIVTESDIFDAFRNLLGVRWPSYESLWMSTAARPPCRKSRPRSGASGFRCPACPPTPPSRSGFEWSCGSSGRSRSRAAWRP